MSSIERYLKIRFEPRQVKGLEATYRGPKKLKKSGKAAGVKKSAKKKVAANAKKTPVKPAKQKHLKRKAAPPRPATAKPANVNSTDGSKKTIEEGFRPLRKRP